MAPVRRHLICAIFALAAGCDEGPAVHANAQTIAFSTAPIPGFDQTTVVVSATASSGLPVRYTSLTRTVCSVDGNTGLVTGLTSGTCTIAANQPGDAHFAPAPQVRQSMVFGFSQETLAVTEYKVVATFYEPDTQPNDTIFVGWFTHDATTGAVSNLRGTLSESMTGGSPSTMSLQPSSSLSVRTTRSSGAPSLSISRTEWSPIYGAP